MNEYLDIYLAEAKELLDEMNSSLLELEKNTEDADLINSIFRAAHTIKGNSAVMGFKSMEKLTHGMENILQDLREGKAEVNGKIMELLFVCHDFLENNLIVIMETGNEEEVSIDEILGKLHTVIGETCENEGSEAESVSKDSPDCAITLDKQEAQSLKESIAAGSNAYLIRIKPAEDCAFKSVRVWMWFRELASGMKIIKSDPEKPVSDNIADDPFVFSGEAVKLLAVSGHDIRQLAGELEKLSDVDRIDIEPVKLEKAECMKDQLDLIMSHAAISIPDPTENGEDAGSKAGELKAKEIETAFSGDFINEISVQLGKMDGIARGFEDRQVGAKALHKISRLFHTVKGLAGFIRNGQIAELADTAEQLAEYYRKEKIEPEREQIRFFAISSELINKLCKNNELSGNKAFLDEIAGHILCMEREMHKEIPEEVYNEAVAEVEKAAGIVQGQPERPARNQTEMKTGRNPKKTIGSSFMRVSTQKIDNLVDMLGELLVMHSVMQQEASERFDSNDKYMNNLQRMTKTIKGIQNLSMSLRMVVIKQALQNTMRVGRDTAAELGKKVEITIKGEETEIDRNIADRLVDPLMHLVRNAVGHGIESREERIKAGKSEEGHVTIQALSKKGFVYIEVEDDGKGLSLEKIHAKALEKNLIDPHMNYSEEEIMKFIFLPGFSTQETIDNISGRGVGMNVVETEVKKVGGKIDVDSRPGQGCRFTLKIPLNLAVMNGTIVDILGGRYIIPTLYIKQFMKPEASQWVSVKNKRSMVRVRDELIPVIAPDKVLGSVNMPREEDENLIIILEVEQKFKAIPVRSVIGRQEIVAKPLDKEFGRLDYASGASILGDGKISLILDVEAMFGMN